MKQYKRMNEKVIMSPDGLTLTVAVPLYPMIENDTEQSSGEYKIYAMYPDSPVAYAIENGDGEFQVFGAEAVEKHSIFLGDL